ncbi:MAG: hypothetical protein AAF311_09185 [Pseudomonadota bacterium]
MLIMVVFNVETGSEVETRMDLVNVADCHAAARDTFKAVDEQVEIQAMDVPAGQEILEGTMIAYGATGGEIGMYACNVRRASMQHQRG